MSTNSSPSTATPSPEEIAARAYRIYLTEGRPEGRALEHWMRAERELMSEPSARPAPAARHTRSAVPKSPVESTPTTARI